MASLQTSFITPDLLRKLPDVSIALCAHDAGAARLLAGWMAPLAQQLRLYVAGPAADIFESELDLTGSADLQTCLSHAQVLISGTGWASDLEHRSRVQARKLAMPSVAVLDHWVNYRERFVWGNEEVLPDLLWVADHEAATLARQSFPEIPVITLSNQWIGEIRQTVADGNRAIQQPARRLIYLLEPIRVAWPETSEAGEFQALRYWLEQLPMLADIGWVAPVNELEALELRTHPSEAKDKYDEFIAKMSKVWPIRRSESPCLASALAWADAAFGCETQALAAAIACGIPSFSTLPPWAPSCRLPHTSLHHLCRF